MDYSIAAKIARDCLRIDSVRFPAANVLTVAHDNDRSLLVDGRWYSPLIDTIEDDLRVLGVECVSAARIISRIKGEKAYGRVYSPEGAFARALVAKRLHGRLRPGRYPYSQLEERAWTRILEQTGARRVLGIQPSRELCVAGRKRGVWTADVQHGVINDHHPWYTAAHRGDEPSEWLPDAFLCWDDESRQVIEPWAAGKQSRAIVTGNRWLARFSRPSADDLLVKRLVADFEACHPNPQRKPAILVALSWGEVNIANGFLDESLLAVIRATSDRFHWWIRLHPNQLIGFATQEGRRFRKFFRQHLDGLVDWQLASRAPLPLVLKHSDLAICWNSSVVIEAAQMGLRAALLDPRLRAGGDVAGGYSRYEASGRIDLLDPAEQALHGWIDANLGSKSAAAALDDADVEYRRLLAAISG
jgi:hypothetical protein